MSGHVVREGWRGLVGGPVAGSALVLGRQFGWEAIDALARLWRREI